MLVAEQGRGEAGIRNEVLAMQPYLTWQELMAPIPFSVALLGQLMLIAAQVYTNDKQYYFTKKFE